MYGGYGTTAKVPMLWVYTENDMYFGPQLPRDWHRAFVGAGAKAQLLQLPPHGDDGHSLFTHFPQAWQPRVGEFLDSLGFPAPAGRAR
jgi:homoserine acetyltransferase